MKIALGSAQFGLDYGVNNHKGMVASDEIDNILNYAKSVNIDTIDTAQAYGDSEKVIGNLSSSNDFKIITKIAFNTEESVENLISNSLTKLNINKIYGILFHNFDDYRNNPNILDEIRREKESGKLDKYGFSLYYPEELSFLLDNNIDFDLVQIPYSIFDRRFESLFGVLRERKIEVHVRSVFLQGLVFMSPDSLSDYLKVISPTLKNLNTLASKNKISLTSIALNFVMNQKLIDKVVIGVDSLAQLKENIIISKENIIIKSISSKIDKLEIDNEKILLPFNWK